jgi:hypothetical protein
VETKRDLILHDRRLESRTKVINRGESPLTIRWFAHPFFPTRERQCRFSPEASMPASEAKHAAFGLASDGVLTRNPGYPWERGFFQPLEAAFGRPLRVEQFHPAIGTVLVACDFPLAWLPVWGNARTFSFEPYLEKTLAAGESASWGISYGF